MDQILKSVGFKPFCLGSLLTVLGIVKFDEVFEVVVGEGVGFKGEMFVGSEVVDPELSGLGVWGAGSRAHTRN